MPSIEKAELKVLVYEGELESLQKDIRHLESQKELLRGYSIAYKECVDLYGEIFKAIKKAMDWEQLPAKEKKKKLKDDPKAEPELKFTAEEASRVAQLVRPVQMKMSLQHQKSEQEPGKMEAQVFALKKQVERIEKLIASEKAKAEEERIRELEESDA